MLSKLHQEFFHKDAIGDCDDDTMSFKKNLWGQILTVFQAFSFLNSAASSVIKTQWKLCTTRLVSIVCWCLPIYIHQIFARERYFFFFTTSWCLTLTPCNFCQILTSVGFSLVKKRKKNVPKSDPLDLLDLIWHFHRSMFLGLTISLFTNKDL